MNPLSLPRMIARLFAPTAIAALVLTFAVPVTGQGLVEYGVELLPLSTGFHASAAMGMSDGDWDPPIIVGRLLSPACPRGTRHTFRAPPARRRTRAEQSNRSAG